MRVCKTVGIATLLLLANYFMVSAAYLTVDALSLTEAAHSFGGAVSVRMAVPYSLELMPFYLRIDYPANNNSNWGIELYTNNQSLLGGSTTSDGLYRGLRGMVNVDHSVPLYWQVYNHDLNVASTYGTPVSITSTVGELGFYTNTLRYWGIVYDVSDTDRVSTWNEDRDLLRTVVSVDGMGNYPVAERQAATNQVYVYFGGDIRATPSEDYQGLLTLDLFLYPFDYNTGCYATPNPMRPVLGERAFFNFYTNDPNAEIKIKIFDTTGFPVVTLNNTRYWDGRNSNYQYVEGGLYLYQIEVEGHLISGTVVVIK
ncbi:hypothetical protein K8S19_12460 [bacterium]|nr:hypothetical protein [bacterium]